MGCRVDKVCHIVTANVEVREHATEGLNAQIGMGDSQREVINFGTYMYILT